MKDTPQSKSRPLTDQNHTPLPPVTGPWIRCEDCLTRAYLVPDWKPSHGIDPLFRKFTCFRHHDTFKLFTASDLVLLTKVNGTNPGR